jgi:hypothetical protein
MSIAEPAPAINHSCGKTPAHPAKSDSKTRGRGKDVIALTSIVTGTRSALHVYFFCWKRGRHYADEQGIRLRAFEHCDLIFFAAVKRDTRMMALRLYVSALTLLFLFLVIAYRGLEILEAVVITCAILYLILDVRTDLHALKNELRLLQELEKQVSLLLR